MTAPFDIGQIRCKLNKVQPLATSNHHEWQLCAVQLFYVVLHMCLHNVVYYISV